MARDEENTEIKTFSFPTHSRNGTYNSFFPFTMGTSFSSYAYVGGEGGVRGGVDQVRFDGVVQVLRKLIAWPKFFSDV